MLPVSIILFAALASAVPARQHKQPSEASPTIWPSPTPTPTPTLTPAESEDPFGPVPPSTTPIPADDSSLLKSSSTPTLVSDSSPSPPSATSAPTSAPTAASSLTPSTTIPTPVATSAAAAATPIAIGDAQINDGRAVCVIPGAGVQGTTVVDVDVVRSSFVLFGGDAAGSPLTYAGTCGILPGDTTTFAGAVAVRVASADSGDGPIYAMAGWQLNDGKTLHLCWSTLAQSTDGKHWYKCRSEIQF
ncbi:hypothetical protein PYCC9005_001673 [Savitreella phatthalungensis]